jgi:hexosaminidase
MILSPAHRVYIDHKYDKSTALGLNWAGFIDVRTAYDWEPATALAGVDEPLIHGIEAPLWSETIATMRDVEQLAFPRLAAIAEVAWTPASGRKWEAFRERLGAHAPRFRALGVNFFPDRSVPWQ